MSVPTRICSRCHARVALEASVSLCPACAGTLVADPASVPENTALAQVDHRGIVVPPRHAVGGIITPR